MEFQNLNTKILETKKITKNNQLFKNFIIQKIHQTVFYCTTWWTQNFIGRNKFFPSQKPPKFWKFSHIILHIQAVSEISTLILTGTRTHQKEQLFSLPFWRKTLRSGLKNRKDFPKTFISPKLSYLKT
jgi:hypothetical protein